MKDRVILPLAKPMLRTWPSESHFMSMILQQKDARSWIYNNYINLEATYYPDVFYMSFFPNHDPMGEDMAFNAWTGCPFLETHFVSHYYIINEYGSILEYVLSAIENEYYLYFYLNPTILKVEKDTYQHKTFIYGYDIAERKLYVADHYNQGKYATAEVDFDDLVAAYSDYRERITTKGINEGARCAEEKNYTVIIARPCAYSYEFNSQWFCMQLRDYLKATYSIDAALFVRRCTEMHNCAWGIGCYGFLQMYLSAILHENEEGDGRLFALLCDHKLLLRDRITFLVEQGLYRTDEDEFREYDELYHMAESVLNQWMKYTLTRQERCIEAIKKLLVEMERREQKLLPLLLDALEA